MSTLDKSFIRAYSKEADVRGVTGPAWYSPQPQVEPSFEPDEDRDPRLDAWRPLEQLYAEGIWYRIEPRQSTTPPPHLPASSLIRARNTARQPQLAPILAETVDQRTDLSQQPIAADIDSPRRAEQPAPPWLWEFSSQYVISAAVACLPESPSFGAAESAGLNNAQDDRRAVLHAVAAAVSAPAVVEREAGAAADRRGVASQAAAATPAAPMREAAANTTAQAVLPKSAPAASTAHVEVVSPQGLELPRLDDAKGHVPPPHFAVSKTAGGSRAEPPANSSSSPSLSSRSSPSNSSPPNSSPGQAREANRFEPSWEVDAFVWPELTDRLLRRETRRFTLLTESLAGAARTGRNVVAVTSPAREQGRTTVSLCLARRAAAAGLQVALVDADFENPCLAQRLRVNPTCGWQDTLSAKLPLSEAAVTSTRDGVTLLPLRVASVGRDDEATLDPHEVVELIDQLSHCFDLVILDMEPAEPEDLSDDDQAAQADANLHPALVALLVFDDSSDEDQLADAVAQLRSAGIETLGAVENFFPART